MNIPDAQSYERTITTDASGDADVDVGPFRGYLDSIDYTKTDFATGVDFTITAKATGETLWTQINQDASVKKRPASLLQDTAGADTTQYDRIWIEGDVNIVIANGGNAKSGTFKVVCIG